MTRLLRTLPLAVVAAALLLAGPASAYKVKDVKPPAASVGVAYTFTFEPDGGSAPHKFRVDSGGLPPGLTLSDEGLLAGTPTTAGSWSFWIQAIDSTDLKTERRFTVDVSPKLTVATSSLPVSTVGIAYSAHLSVSGGTAQSWSLASGSLPPGLSLLGNGTIAGTPQSEGTAVFTVLVSDGSKTDSKQLTLSVVAPLGVGTEAMAPALVGKPFAVKINASGGSGGYFFQLAGGTLPNGLVLDGATGLISGSPRTAGTFPLKVLVSAAGGGSALQGVTLVVKRSFGLTTLSLPAGKQGRRYAAAIRVAGGVAPVTFESVSTFPPGIQLNAETGRLSGKPTRPGTYRIAVTARDSFGGVTSRRYVIRVR